MNKKLLFIAVAVVLLLGVGVLYGVVTYSGNNFLYAHPNNGGVFQTQERSNSMDQDMMGKQKMESAKSNVGLTAGEVTAKDDTSITIKARDGSMRKIMLMDSTDVTRSMESSPDEIEVGERVSVVGEMKEDGTLQARAVQIK